MSTLGESYHSATGSFLFCSERRGQCHQGTNNRAVAEAGQQYDQKHIEPVKGCHQALQARSDYSGPLRLPVVYHVLLM